MDPSELQELVDRVAARIATNRIVTQRQLVAEIVAATVDELELLVEEFRITLTPPRVEDTEEPEQEGTHAP